MNTVQKAIIDALASTAPAATATTTRIQPARRAPRCQYVKVNGLQCGSPALHRHRLCYFHNRMRLPRPSGAPFPPLEDGPSIQYALMTVLQDLRDRRIDYRTAGLLLYGLQTASFNLRQSQFGRGDVVRSDPGELLSNQPPETVMPSEVAPGDRVEAPCVSSRPKATRRRPKASPQPALIAEIHACAKHSAGEGARSSPSSTGDWLLAAGNSRRKPQRYAKL